MNQATRGICTLCCFCASQSILIIHIIAQPGPSTAQGNKKYVHARDPQLLVTVLIIPTLRPDVVEV